MVIPVYFRSWILIFTRQCPLTCIDDMHIDMLGVAGAGVTLVLATVLLNKTLSVITNIVNSCQIYKPLSFAVLLAHPLPHKLDIFEAQTLI